jgi:hypothetical protein
MLIIVITKKKIEKALVDIRKSAGPTPSYFATSVVFD